MVKWDENGLTITAEVSITRDEAESLADWIETDFIDDLRNNEDGNSLEFIENILRIYRKCKDYLEKGDGNGE